MPSITDEIIKSAKVFERDHNAGIAQIDKLKKQYIAAMNHGKKSQTIFAMPAWPWPSGAKRWRT